MGKVIALKNAGWSHAKIADEMGVQTASISQAIYKHKKEMEEQSEAKKEKAQPE